MAKAAAKAGTVDPRTGYLSEGLFETLAKRTLAPLSTTEIRDVEAQAEKAQKRAAHRIKNAEGDVRKAVAELNQASLLFAPEELARYQQAVDQARAKLRQVQGEAAESQAQNQRVLERVRRMSLAP